MADEPTLGEVMRQVQALVRQVEALVKEVRLDYVRKDLYDARHAALTRRVEDVKSDVDEVKSEADERERNRQAFQRQVIGGLIVGVVMLLLNVGVTLALVIGGIQ